MAAGQHFFSIGKFFELSYRKKLLREDAHAKARKMSHKCDAFAARNVLSAHSFLCGGFCIYGIFL